MDRFTDEKIDWQSADSHFLINPRLGTSEAARAKDLLQKRPDLPGHLWVQSSGSARSVGESTKWIALSKPAFLASAQAVNQHLRATSKDRWGLVLPTFHVGGLSILARAFLSGSSVARGNVVEWRPERFGEWLVRERITLLSLVPAQLFDLVAARVAVPPGVRAVILGGDRLDPDLEQRAKSRGWPVLASYGMTELCSQVATAAEDQSGLRLLSHVQTRTDAEDRLWIKSPALFSGALQERQGEVFFEPPLLSEGYWRSNDRALLQGNLLTVLGRAGDFIKINGEGMDLSELRSRFESWLLRFNQSMDPSAYAVTAITDDRAGHRLVLAAVESKSAIFREALDQWNQQCFPLERLELREVSRIPRSDLGKVLFQELNELLPRA